MKRIEAIIRESKVSEVCAALDRVGHPGVTVSSVEGRGKQKGWVHRVRSMAFNVSLLSRARVEVVATDEDAGTIISAIRGAAATGEVGDGKIFVHDMAEVISIRTNASGAAAL